MNRVLVDTGFLVALFRRNDRQRAAARDYLMAHRHPLVTVSAVIVETCFFLDARGKSELLLWVQRGGIAVADVPIAAYAAAGALIRKYADRDIDFADAALVWLAHESGLREILTVDEKDFAVFRLKGGRRFDIVPWMS